MATVERVMTVSPEKVWEVLADGWLYPVWVVGASRMREVDETWPAEDAKLHHSVGSWPMLLDDTTSVIASEEPRELVLTARGWPMGEARVTLTLVPEGAGTRVTIEEEAVSGPGALVPRLVADPGIAWRNTETLRRLAYLAERR
ncbi:polyketide cyclase [Marmoricola sp. Leaf446]|uniref:SRPBCC family protein n=1 Tax=Marmoricola sp. Leaf446 TaxID=1736379 RepID=UPI0006F80EA7|nr:SRPBCC family protein [Marmoricola sp. Leaf446]KQT92358.1 polyketide cyclase [Marmoricola sp. Leaf446]